MTTSITEFWNKHGAFTLDEYGFDIKKNGHYVFIGRDKNNNIHSMVILVPFMGIAHHIHLCSIYKSKALFKFAFKTLIAIAKMPKIKTVLCETQGNPRYEAGGRIAKAFGFEPIPTNMGWTDYVWKIRS